MGLDLGIALGDFPLVTFVELGGLAQIQSNSSRQLPSRLWAMVWGLA